MVYFDKDCEPANDIVVLRVIDHDTLSRKGETGGFVVGDDSLRNLRLGFYQIVKIGPEAKERTGLDAGAYVFADRLASFYHTEPVALMRYNALVMETNADRTKYRALEGRCIVQEVSDSGAETGAGGFVVPTADGMKIGVVKSITPPYAMTESAVPFKVGDRVLLTKDEHDTLHGFKGDSSLDPSKPILIYRTDAILAKLV